MQVATAASAVTGAPLHVTTPMALPQFISPYSQAHPTQPYQPYQQVKPLLFKRGRKIISFEFLFPLLGSYVS